MQKGIDYPAVGVVYFCHDGEGNFVMSKRSNRCRDEHGCWDPGGGGIDLHESVEDTLKREVKEEYCSDVLDYELLGYRSVHREHDGNKTHWVQLDFKVKVDRGKVKNGEPHKFDAVEWFSLDNLPEPLHSQMEYFIEKYKDKLI